MTRRRSLAAGANSARVAVLGILLIAVAVGSDFVIGSFWSKHAFLTSILASLLIVVLSVALINELLEARNRRRWSLLAQSVLFALVQSARLTWTTMLEVLHLAEVQSGAIESLEQGAAVALDTETVSEAVTDLLADPARRQQLQLTLQRLSDHASAVISVRAGVMVGAAPYAKLLDRHVELQARLEWLNAVLAHREPPPDRSLSMVRLTRANVAIEHAVRFGEDWIHDMLVSITVLAVTLDDESRQLAFSVAGSWWTQPADAMGAAEQPTVNAGTGA